VLQYGVEVSKGHKTVYNTTEEQHRRWQSIGCNVFDCSSTIHKKRPFI